MSRSKGERADSGQFCNGLDDPILDKLLPFDSLKKLRDDVEMVRGIYPKFDRESYLNGSTSPIWFGSAVNNFGVLELLEGLKNLAPSPIQQKTAERNVLPDEEKVSGFVFKIQANMDRNHRDRIAFLRICSGHFKKGHKLFHVRSGKTITVHNPQMFLARDREIAEEAWPGDIIGIPNHGNLRIGDSLTEGEKLTFRGIPTFSPELLQIVRPKDPMKAKHLGKALQQLAEEGAASVFKPLIGANWIVGVVGQLQFEIMADRIRTEYGLSVYFDKCDLFTALWLVSKDKINLNKFINRNEINIAEDHDGIKVFLARNPWHLDKIKEEWPDIDFNRTREQIN